MMIVMVVDNDLTLLHEYIRRTEHLKLGEIRRFSTPHHKNWFLGLAYVHPFSNQEIP
jgi:hypothetical protein